MTTLLLQRLNHWYRHAHWGWCTLALLGATYCIVLPPALFAYLFDPAAAPGPGSSAIGAAGFAGRILLGSVAAPLLETAFLQWAPIRLLRGTLGCGPAVSVFTSAALFSATHSYSLGYIVFAFLVGLVLAYGFLARSYPGGRAFPIVVGAHALRNFIATIAVEFSF